MSNDVEGIQRVVIGFSKIPNKYGNCYMEVQYKLKPLNLSFLQALFNIDPNDPDPGVVDLIDPYPINQKQAEALQPYVIDGVIDLERYTFYLDAYKKDS
jgi:hypothetical protein